MIFHKQHFFGWKFWILLIFSFLLLILDQKNVLPPHIKRYLQTAAEPFEYSVALPERSINFLRDYFIAQHDLVHAKKKLQGQQLILQAKLQEMNTLKQQNQELQSLLKTAPVEQDQKYLLARVIAINTEGRSRELLINRGSRAGIHPGQGIVAADGIIGQVIQVTPFNSHAILLSDSRSAIPVLNERSQENFIVIGHGDNQDLTLLNAATNMNIKVGDALQSSGLGGHYPPGSPVGIVSAIQMKGKNIDQVHIRPAANLDRLHLILVVFVKDEANS